MAWPDYLMERCSKRLALDQTFRERTPQDGRSRPGVAYDQHNKRSSIQTTGFLQRFSCLARLSSTLLEWRQLVRRPRPVAGLSVTHVYSIAARGIGSTNSTINVSAPPLRSQQRYRLGFGHGQGGAKSSRLCGNSIGRTMAPEARNHTDLFGLLQPTVRPGGRSGPVLKRLRTRILEHGAL